MSAVANIRVVPAVFKRRGDEVLVPVIRFVDPDQSDPDQAEFFRVHVDHVDQLIEGIQRARFDAVSQADLYRQSSEEDRALMGAQAGGQA